MSVRHLAVLFTAAFLAAGCGSPAPTGSGAPGSPSAVISSLQPGPSVGATGLPSPSSGPTSSTGPASAPASTASGTEVHGTVGVDWVRVPLPDTLTEGIQLTSVASGGDSIVAAGESFYGFPVAWYSTDGIAWHKSSLKSAFEQYDFGTNTLLTDAWRGQSNAAVRGTSSGFALTSGDRDTWTSTDGGRTFNQNAHATTGLGVAAVGKLAPGYFQGMGASGDAVVAVSSATRRSPVRLGSIAWRSADGGKTWTGALLPVPAKSTASHIGGTISIDGANGLAAGSPITTGRDSLYNAVFSRGPMDVWQSEDGGASWTRTTSPAFTADADPIASAVASDARIIVGARVTDRGFVPGAWTANGGTWTGSRLPLPPGVTTGIAMTVVLASDGTPVTAGWTATPAGPTTATVWTTEGGTTWSAHVVPGPTGASSRITALAPVAGGLVAAGTVSGDAAIWVSGTFLVPAPPAATEATAMTAARPDAVATLPDGSFVAAGRDLGSQRLAAWTSPDGTTWTRVPDASMPPTPAELAIRQGTQEPVKILLAASGGTVLATLSYGIGWTSTDGGRTWRDAATSGLSAVDHDCGRNTDRWAASGVSSVAPTGDAGFVAVGRGSMCHGADTGDVEGSSWTSLDGHSWTFAPYDRAAFGPRGSITLMSAVTAVSSGWVAVGTTRGTGSRDEFASWLSTDGLHWSRRVLSSPGGASPQAVAARGATVVAVGTMGSTYVPTAWVSSDAGATWSPGTPIVSGPEGAGAAVSAITMTASGFVAVGTRAVGVNTVPVAWTTSDGRAWTPVDLAPDKGLSGIKATGVATNGSATVAIGSVVGTATFWTVPSR